MILSGLYYLYFTYVNANEFFIFDDVKIPLKDSTGKNYNPNKFALEIFKFFRSLNLQVEKDIKGNTIYITIK